MLFVHLPSLPKQEMLALANVMLVIPPPKWAWLQLVADSCAISLLAGGCIAWRWIKNYIIPVAMEQFIRVDGVHLMNVAGGDKSDSSSSEDCSDNDYRPLLAYNIKLDPTRRATTTMLCKKLAGVKWRNLLIVAVSIFDYFLVYSAISLIGTFFLTQVSMTACR